MTPDELREHLLELEDVGYREFHLRTCPQAQHVIGVRMPEQRKLAKQIIRSDYWRFLDGFEPHYYEEVLITGIVIATAPMGLSERLDYVAWFVPLISNWAICDCFCASFKFQVEDLPAVWDFITQYASSDAEYALRFMFVMILDHFLRPEYLDRIFALLDQVQSSAHYVEMAKAWLVAELFIKFRDETLDYLLHDQLSQFAHNKAIQKACESYRVSDADKQTLRGMKL